MKTYLQNIVTNSTIFSVVIFNDCKDNIFFDTVGYAGYGILFYYPSFWRDHITAFIIHNEDIFSMTIDVKEYIIHDCYKSSLPKQNLAIS